MKKIFQKTTIAAAFGILATGLAHAGDTIEFENGVNLDWSVTASYNVAMRVAKPDPLLTGERNMWAIRYNDGNNNFDQWSLVNNRVSALFQAKISKGDSGFVLSGSTFYDDVYHRGNDNKIDKFKPRLNNGNYAQTGGVSPPVSVSTVSAVGQFTPEAKRLHGGYSRFLDAYAYTNVDIFGRRANIKVGRHVVSWGESLFFPNISMAQGPLDGSKANVPGTEIKEIMLPEDQISLSWQLSPNTTLLANYQYNWHPTTIDAVGSYLSRSDVIGAGGICLGDWRGDASNPGANPGNSCRFLPFGYVPETGNSIFSGAGPGALVGDILPSKSGSAGIGLRQRISEDTELGVYYLRYNERVPLPLITYNVSAAKNRAPNHWERFYQPNVHLLGASFTTSLGSYVLGGEIAHRRGAPVLAGGTLPAGFTGNVLNTTLPFGQFGTTRPAMYEPTTANLTQVNLNTFANFGRTFLAPRTLLLAEAAWVNVSGFNPVVFKSIGAPTVPNPNCSKTPSAGGACVPIGDELKLYSKNNLGIQARFQLDYPGFAEGWDLSVPISYGQQLMGQNMLSNLGGKGDKILGISTEFTRGNLQLSASYVNWLGKPSTDDLGSRVLTDRDFVSLGVKYTF